MAAGIAPPAGCLTCLAALPKARVGRPAPTLAPHTMVACILVVELRCGGRESREEWGRERRRPRGWLVSFASSGAKALASTFRPMPASFFIGADARDQEADESHRPRGWGLRRSAGAAGRRAGAGREQRRQQCLGGPSSSSQLAAWAGQPCSHPQLVGSLGARPVHPLHQPVGLPTCQPQVSVLPCLVPRLATHTPRALLG